jgi:hypothetical protein
MLKLAAIVMLASTLMVIATEEPWSKAQEKQGSHRRAARDKT